MRGECDVATLCASLQPRRASSTCVYCCLPDFVVPDGIGNQEALLVFREREGLTLVIEKSAAKRLELAYEFEATLITLDIHSSLDAVGFIATIAAELAHACIPCNAVAAYYHDHLLVPEQRACEAMRVLTRLRSRARRELQADNNKAAG
ncbi:MULTISPECIES: ACT domain-containing protein [Paraburkholderia]|uniref:ACT domain-containing protein n=1 Tax=Paraburkholderia phytofirmans TaxID=261302 RepID=A0ABW9BKS9_9BURK